MNVLPEEIISHILSFCERSTLLVIRFVSKEFLSLSGPLFKEKISTMSKYCILPTLCKENVMYNNLELVQWYYETFSDLKSFDTYSRYSQEEIRKDRLLPEYSDISTVEIMEYICRHYEPNEIIYPRSREVAEWILKNYPKMIDILSLISLDCYDLLEKVNTYELVDEWGWDIEDFPNVVNARKLCVWMVENKRKIPYNTVVLLLLTGGGYHFVNDLLMASYSHQDTIEELPRFECPNLGGRYLEYIFKKHGEMHPGHYLQCIFKAVIEADNVEALKVLKSQFGIKNPNDLFDFCLRKTETPCLEVVKWLVENSHISKQNVIYCADKDILLFLRDNGFVLGSEVYMAICYKKDFELLKFAYEIGVPWDTFRQHVIVGNYRRYEATISTLVASWGDVEVFQWCVNRGFPIEPQTIDHAGTIEMLKYLEDLGMKATSDIYSQFEFENNNGSYLEYLLDSGYDIDQEMLDHLCRYSKYENISNYIREYCEKDSKDEPDY